MWPRTPAAGGAPSTAAPPGIPAMGSVNASASGWTCGIFGWMKTVGGFRRTRFRGVDKTGLAGYLVATAYNLVRLARLLLPPTVVETAA